ncbi:TetR family transcriptional regulator OS=Streptomyces fumanus OX=67302 GN=GCM10018772_01330 PE=4 SV=1 [Streptomyces fumanus]|uniref:TetR family transcriptional regulator n=1 Tax=Streptomyces fumanus TaxID=67302 RepID=A0A919A137_9ACTN|nr:TetR family transcriptional regulator [Streptomyces fumanus]GHE82847.1 TetR family transcriptional regulator [Streptomyces fumanus]
MDRVIRATAAEVTEVVDVTEATRADGTGRAGGTVAAAPVRSAAGPARSAAAPVRSAAAPLTERQEARRRRILDASAELAGRGGFDAVQMREVAEVSQVALGTLYRYFPSKVHLLVATMQDRLEQLHATLRGRPPAGDTAAERVARTLMRAFRALRREPELADAMVRAVTFADRGVSAEVDRVSRQTTAIILDAMGVRDPGPGQLAAVRVIEHTWYSALIAWLAGRASIDQVRADIETACRLIGPPGDG